MASGEDSLIARYFRPLATDPGAFGLGDDAAVLDARGDEIVVTTDAIVEGVHFLLGRSARDPRAQGAAGESQRSRGEGRDAGGVRADAGAAFRRRCVAGIVCARARRGYRSVRLPAAGRRYRLDAGSADDLDHGVRARPYGQNGPSQRRETGRPRCGDGNDRRRRARPRYSQGRRGGHRAGRRCRGKGDAGRAVSCTAAAQRAGESGPRSRSCGDGCVRRSCGRSRQAVRGVRRVRRRSMRKASRYRRPPRHCSRAAPSASRLWWPAATITRFYVRSPRASFEAFAQGAGLAGVAVTSIGTVIAGTSSPDSWTGRAGRSRFRACPTAISRILAKSAAFRNKYMLKSTVYALRGVAPGI